MKIILFLIVFINTSFAQTRLPIMQIGNPILRATALEVSQATILDPKFQKLIDDMVFTMKKAGGVGLAAPQINESIRVFVMQSGLRVPLTIVINPRIEYIEAEGKLNSDEGCLSIPGRSIRVKRYKKIHLSYFNRKGEFISKELKGFGAIIAQHEYDHLNGILIVDIMEQLHHSMNYTGHANVPLM